MFPSKFRVLLSPDDAVTGGVPVQSIVTQPSAPAPVTPPVAPPTPETPAAETPKPQAVSAPSLTQEMVTEAQALFDSAKTPETPATPPTEAPAATPAPTPEQPATPAPKAEEVQAALDRVFGVSTPAPQAGDDPVYDTLVANKAPRAVMERYLASIAKPETPAAPPTPKPEEKKPEPVQAPAPVAQEIRPFTPQEIQALEYRAFAAEAVKNLAAIGDLSEIGGDLNAYIYAAFTGQPKFAKNDDGWDDEGNARVREATNQIRLLKIDARSAAREAAMKRDFDARLAALQKPPEPTAKPQMSLDADIMTPPFKFALAQTLAKAADASGLHALAASETAVEVFRAIATERQTNPQKPQSQVVQEVVRRFATQLSGLTQQKNDTAQQNVIDNGNNGTANLAQGTANSVPKSWAPSTVSTAPVIPQQKKFTPTQFGPQADREIAAEMKRMMALAPAR
jgi:hypothetical protein